MEMQARLGKDSAWILAARLGTQVLMVIFTMLLARQLGSNGLGEYALMAAILLTGNMLTTFGSDMLLIREIAARGDLSALPGALLIQIALSALFVLLVLLGAPYFPHQSPSGILALQIYSFTLFPLAFYTIFTSALRGKEQMNTYALLGLATALLQVLIVWRLPTGNLPILAAWLFVIQFTITVLAGLLCARQIPGFWQAWHVSPQSTPAVLRASAPIALLAILGAIYQKLGIYLLSAFAGAALTGLFSAALRIIEASKIIHISVFTAIYPAMARAQGQTELTRTLHYVWVLLLVGAAGAGALLSWLAAPLVNFLFGPGFSAAIPALRILAWILIPYTVTTFLSLTLLNARRESGVAIAFASGTFALAVLNLLWLPALGLNGAALSALIAECVQAGILLIQIKNKGWSPIDLPKPGKSHELSKLS